MPATIELHDTFCKNVIERRKRLGLTQADVAQRLDVHQSTYAGIENGKAEPGIRIIGRVAEALETTADKLLKN